MSEYDELKKRLEQQKRQIERLNWKTDLLTRDISELTKPTLKKKKR